MILDISSKLVPSSPSFSPARTEDDVVVTSTSSGCSVTSSGNKLSCTKVSNGLSWEWGKMSF